MAGIVCAVLVAVTFWLAIRQLVKPERAMRGERWRFRGSEKLEFSEGYRSWIRIRAVLGILAMLALLGGLVWQFVQADLKVRDHQREAVRSVWGVEALPTDEDARIRIADVPVESGAPEVRTHEAPVMVYGVVGSATADPEVVAGRAGVIVFEEARDGDLVVGVRWAPPCELTAVTVQETDSEVAVGVNTSWPRPAAPAGTEEPCDLPALVFSELALVHVPLEQPLGDRRVVDGRQGVAAESIGAG